MKKIIIMPILIMALNLLFHPGYTQGLTIIEQDYEKAKTESRKQKKLLLIDFYTTWCAPCKKLDAMIFKDTAITNELAKTFVVLKYDAEKDSIHKLSLKHHVGSYPTTIVLNPDQYVIHRLYGTGGPDKDIPKNYQAFLSEAIVKYAKHKYIKGISNTTDLRYPKFYEEYVYRTNTKLTDQKVADYWKNTSDYYSEVPFSILCYFGGGTDIVDSFFLSNRKTYEDLYGELDVRFATTMIINKKIYAAIDAKDKKRFSSAIELARENMDQKNIDMFVEIAEERMLQSEGRWDEAVKKFAIRKTNTNMSDEEINDFCWTVYLKSTDEQALRTCVEWMKTITDKNPEYMTLDTYARLLYKAGEKKQARHEIEKAIKIGKTQNEDTTDSEKWLKKIDQ